MATKKKPIPAIHKQQVNTNKPVENLSQPKTQPQTISHGKAKQAESIAADFAFGKLNYLLMLAGIALMVIGYILMIGGGSTDPKVFNESIFNSQRLTIAPILILLGFAVEIVAILKKPSN